MKDQWYHNAIIYSLDVETYRDSTQNGIGDFTGLVSKLDHLSGLGVNCIWLRPFYPSPLVDDGYDVSDYYNVSQHFGTLGDFVDFIKKAHALGLRVIVDLVVNHTSDQHIWFQQARKDKNSKFRDFYMWKEEEPSKEDQKENMLGQGGIWNYDDQARAYYMHHFHKEQPDLNISNPEVVKEIKKIMGFWLQLGVSGFRIDAAHIMVHESKGQVFEILGEMREFINARNNEAILLGEANVPIDELEKFFGKDCENRMHLLFNFYLNKSIFLSFASKSAKPMMSILKQLGKIKGHWVNFLRHHDELNLEMLSESERDEVFEAYAPDENMRIFGHGIRRRLPPMMEGNRKKMELIYTVMFSLPGIPLINYGEEIAMGDDLGEEGRASVRTAMQWNNQKNAGFSEAEAQDLVHPVIDSGEYDYRITNVSDQQKDPSSFLNWMERLISTRKHSPQLSYGDCTIIESDSSSVLSFFNNWNSEVVILLHNLSDQHVNIKLDTAGNEFGKISEIFSDQYYDTIEDIEDKIHLSGYGYRWFKGNIKDEKK